MKNSDNEKNRWQLLTQYNIYLVNSNYYEIRSICQSSAGRGDGHKLYFHIFKLAHCCYKLVKAI